MLILKKLSYFSVSYKRNKYKSEIEKYVSMTEFC